MPIYIDFFAVIILLGISQGYFLGGFFLWKRTKSEQSSQIFGILLWVLSSTSLEVLLCYTNYMFQAVWLIDFSEPLNFLIAPLIYLYIRSQCHPLPIKKVYLHFLPFGFYLLYSFFWQYQSLAYKYNAYIHAFHPQLLSRPVELWIADDPLAIKSHISLLTGLSIVGYLIGAAIFIYREFQKKGIVIWKPTSQPNLAWARTVWLQSAGLLISYAIIRSWFKGDLGDHILALHFSFVIYATSFKLLSSTDLSFFKPSSEKYKHSSLTSELQEKVLNKLYQLFEQEKPFLNAQFSLPQLAKTLGVSPHHLSQILNQKLQRNFFELIANYRIEESKLLLRQFPELKIEEIAEKIGYSSKSSFNTSFKKYVGKTPSAYRKEAVGLGSSL